MVNFFMFFSSISLFVAMFFFLNVIYSHVKAVIMDGKRMDFE